MDIKNGLEFRTYSFTQYNNLGDTKYDYARYGILNKCLPKILFKGNSVFVTFLQLIDMRLIMLFKYIDKLKSKYFIKKLSQLSTCIILILINRFF